MRILQTMMNEEMKVKELVNHRGHGEHGGVTINYKKFLKK
jgi:hypothetical protein